MCNMMGVCSEHKMLPQFGSGYVTEWHSWLLSLVITNWSPLRYGVLLNMIRTRPESLPHDQCNLG